MNTKLVRSTIALAILPLIALIICIAYACAPPLQAKAAEGFMQPFSNPVPTTPTAITITSESPGKANISWEATTQDNLENQTYTVIYSYSNSPSGLAIINTNTNSCALQNLPEGETLRVQIRKNAQYNGLNLYSSWSPTKTIVIAKSAKTPNIQNPPVNSMLAESSDTQTKQQTSPNSDKNTTSSNFMSHTLSKNSAYDGPARTGTDHTENQQWSNNTSESATADTPNNSTTADDSIIEPSNNSSMTSAETTENNSDEQSNIESASNTNNADAPVVENGLNTQSIDNPAETEDNRPTTNQDTEVTEPTLNQTEENPSTPIIDTDSTIPTPNSVSNVTLSSPSAGIITVTWTDAEIVPNTHDQTYEVRYSYNSDMSNYSTITTIRNSINIRSFIINQPIYVQVRTIAQVGIKDVCSPWSDTVTLDARINQPTETVSNITLNSSKPGEINITWTSAPIDSRFTSQSYEINYSYNSDMSEATTISTTNIAKTITSLTEGKTVYVRIRIVAQYGNENMYAPWSVTKSITIMNTPNPAAVSNLALTSTTPGQVKATWSAPSLVNGIESQSYELRYSYSSNMSGAVTLNTNNVNATLNSLTEGKTLYAQIRSIGKCGTITTYSKWSATKSVAIMTTPTPKTATGLTLTSTTPGKVQIVWTKAATTSGLTSQSYQIRYSYNSDMSNATIANTSNTTYTIGSITEGKKLYIQIRTAAKYGTTPVYSAWSTTQSVTIMKTPTPKIPSSLTVTSNTPLQVSVSWAKASATSGLTNQTYQVRYSYNSDMSGANSVNTSTVNTTLTDLTENKTVYVQVRTAAKYGTVNTYSAWSSAKSITVKKMPRPKAAANLAISSGTPCQVNVTWTKAGTTSGLTDQTHQVRYSYNSDMSGATSVNASGTSTKFTDLNEGKTVYVQIRTRAKYGSNYVYSSWSTAKSITVKKMPRPKAATNLALTSTTPIQVNVTWTKAKATSELTSQIYQIRYSYKSDMSEPQTITSSGASASLTGLNEGKTLYVQIRTRAKYNNAYVYSSWSAAKNIVVKKMPRPKAVTNVKLTSSTPGQVNVSWTTASAVSGLKNQSYQVRYSYNANMSSATTTAASTTNTKLTDLTEGKTIYIQVRTTAKYGSNNVYSAWSTAQSIKIKKKPAPNAATNFQITSSTANQVKCTWTVTTIVSGLSNQDYQVRWSYNADMSSPTTIVATSTNTTIKNLNGGKTIYVQLRTRAKYNSDYVYSNWSDIKHITIKSESVNSGGGTTMVTQSDDNEDNLQEPQTWVPEQGHWEPIYTTIVDQEAYTTTTRIYHTRDGWSGSDREEARAHHAMAGGHLGWEDIVEEHPAVTHREQIGQKWVVDVPGHWE